LYSTPILNRVAGLPVDWPRRNGVCGVRAGRAARPGRICRTCIVHF